MNERQLVAPDGKPPYFRPGGENDSSPYRQEYSQVHVGTETPPEPGSESAGPALFDLVRETRRAYEANSELLREAIHDGHKRNVIEATSGETDTNGNLDLKLFQVPQGHHFTVTRVNVEAGLFTPASPFSAATAWIALIRGSNFAQGSILDFGPPSSGGVILPSIFSTSDSHAPALNGGEILTLHLVGSVTLASTGIWARCQGILTLL